MGVLLALLLHACAPTAAEDLPAGTRETAAPLLARPPADAAPVDREALARLYLEPGCERARERGGDELSRWLAWLRQKLESLFESSGAETYSVLTRFLVLTGATLVGVVLLARLLGRRLRRRSGAPAPPATSALELAPPPRHLERARAALAADPRLAIREGLLAILSHLEASRLARPDRVKTNRELLAELRGRGASEAQVAAVEPLLRWYDDTYYSLAPVASPEAARFLEQAEAFTGARP